MPDTDFLSTIERHLSSPSSYQGVKQGPMLRGVCERRGVPYRLVIGTDGKFGFEWVGDPVIEQEVIAPAMSALDDPRLAGGPQDEFTAARAALREGRPRSYQHAVPWHATLKEHSEHVLAAAGHFGNARGRHGAGEEPHGVEPDEAEAVVASAAVALTLVARRLPTT